MTHYFKVSVSIVKESVTNPSDVEEQYMYVAQGHEYNIVAQGNTVIEAKESFARTFDGQIALDIFHEKKPLEDIGPLSHEEKLLYNIFEEERYEYETMVEL